MFMDSRVLYYSYVCLILSSKDVGYYYDALYVVQALVRQMQLLS